MRWLIVGVLVLSLGAQKLPPVAPARLASEWTTVALPEMPLTVAAHAGALWVAGANEMVARSDDAGRHWRVLHRRPGEMLFDLQFPGGGTVLAYGSGHIRLTSRDNGETWKQDDKAPSLQVILAVSGMSRYGYAGDQIAWTHDGGRRWSTRALHNGPADLPAPILSLAALDGDHAVALAAAPPRPRLTLRKDAEATVPQPGGAEIVARTGDGGGSWQLAQPPPDVAWKTVRASSTGYQLFGATLAGAPRAAQSNDGAHWTLSPPPPANLYDCTAQGCLLEQGWADMEGNRLELWQVPPDPQEPLTAGWAASGDTFCRISATLRCRAGRAGWQRPRTALYVAPKDTDFSHFQEPRVTFAADPDVATYQHDDAGVVLLQVLLGADGSVRQALVRSTPRAEYVPTALAAVRRWKFKPAVRDGKPVAAEALITIGFFQSTP